MKFFLLFLICFIILQSSNSYLMNNRIKINNSLSTSLATKSISKNRLNLFNNIFRNNNNNGGEKETPNNSGGLFNNMGNMLENLKKAQEIAKQAENIQQDLQHTNISGSNRDNNINVKVSGTQSPVSVEISKDFLNNLLSKYNLNLSSSDNDLEKNKDSLLNDLNSSLLEAMIDAHIKTKSFVINKMSEVYSNAGIELPKDAFGKSF